MKRYFTSTLLGVVLFSAHSISAQTCMPCLINSPWQYAKAIVIDNSTNPSPLSNYQVLLTINTQTPISNTEMNSDGSDIRFTSQCTDNIHYWIESGINTPSTQIWVKVPSIAANTIDTIYMYYGNPAAAIASNPDSTFDLYDGFDGSSLDLSKWEVRGVPTYSVSGGQLTFAGNNNWEYIRSYTNFTQPVIIEENHANGGTSFGLVLGYTGTDNRYTFRDNGGMLGCTEDPDVSGGNAWFNTSYPSVPSSTSGAQYYNYKLTAGISGANILAQEYCNVSTSNCNTTPTLLNSYSGSSFYVGFSSYSGSYTGYVDFIRVRKYSAIVPTASLQNTFMLPTVDLGNDTSFCNGGSIILDAGNIGSTYVWSDLSTNQTLNVNSIGTYSVTVTDPNSCTASDIIMITANPSPTVNLGNDTTLCAGDYSLVLDAQNPGASYFWNDGTTTQTLNVSTPGVYYVNITNGFGCQGTDTIDVSVYTIDNTTNTVSLTITANAVFATYQWIDCNNSNLPIAGETNQSYTATANGSYAVIIYQLNCADTSACITINGVGIENQENASFHLYPNPNNGTFYVEVETDGIYTIIDLLGQTVATFKLYAGTKNLVDITQLVSGIYLMNTPLGGQQKIIIAK